MKNKLFTQILSFCAISLYSTAGATTPSITLISPTTGSTYGGTIVTIIGGNFQTGATVSFGTTTATVYTLSSDTIQCGTPQYGLGTVNVMVTNPGNQSSTLSNGFVYISPSYIPQVTDMMGAVDAPNNDESYYGPESTLILLWQQMGLGVSRFDLTMGEIETTRGDYNFDPCSTLAYSWCYDSVMMTEVNNGFTPEPILDAVAPWAANPPVASGSTYVSQYWSPNPPSADSDWVNYVDTCAGRYTSAPYNVKFFDVSNEPVDTSYWDGTSTQFVQLMLIPAATTIHKYGGKVVAYDWCCGGTLSAMSDWLNIDTAWQYIDVLSVHYMGAIVYNQLYPDWIVSGKITTGLWMGECGGQPTGEDYTTDPTFVPMYYPTMLEWFLSHNWTNSNQYKVIYYTGGISNVTNQYLINYNSSSAWLTPLGQAMATFKDVYSGNLAPLQLPTNGVSGYPRGADYEVGADIASCQVGQDIVLSVSSTSTGRFVSVGDMSTTTFSVASVIKFNTITEASESLSFTQATGYLSFTIPSEGENYVYIKIYPGTATTYTSSSVTSVTLNSLDSAQVYLDSTGGVTTYGGYLTDAGNMVAQFGWFPPGNGYGATYKLQRVVLAFDLSTIPAGQSIDSAVLNSWLCPGQPAYLVRFEPGSITGDVWQLTGGSLATTGVVNDSNSASNDFLAPATFIGTIYPTGSNPSTAPYTLDVSSVVQNLYNTQQRYAAFQWRINSETAVQTDSTNGYYYSTGDADTTTAYYTHLVVYYSPTTAVELWDFEASNPMEPAATLPQGKMPVIKE